MRRVKSTVAYKVPAWNKCNLSSILNAPTKDLCRFCCKTKHGHTCLITNDVLTEQGAAVYKTAACLMNTAGFEQDDIEHDEEVPVDLIVSATLKLYEAKLKSLLKKGYAIEVAMHVAKEMCKK